MIPGLAVGCVAGAVALGLAGWGAGLLAFLVSIWTVTVLERWRLVWGGAVGLLGLAVVGGLELGAAVVGALVGLGVWVALVALTRGLD